MLWRSKKVSDTPPPAARPAPRLEPLEQAILQVLAGAARLLTRGELSRIEGVARIRRDPKSIREAVGRLIDQGLVTEPRGKGKGLEITLGGRDALGRSLAA